MKRWVSGLLVVGAFVVACGGKGLSAKAASLHEGDEADLTDCAQLGKVTGTASEGSDAAVRAKNDAREQAAKLGATHIRWIVPCCTSVEAEAYRCDVPSD